MITDKCLADYLSSNSQTRNNNERLLIAEYEGGIDLSLYISADVFKHIENTHPINLIEQGKYSEFCLILEGVSHFLYVVWNASHYRQVTLLEMELQAEIDKFILMQSLINHDQDADLINDLRTWLFENNHYDLELETNELERYERANYYAGKYCRSLQQKYNLSGLNRVLLNDLRRLYRLGQQDKMRYINKLN
ncbi:MAG: hypothetical protein HND53_10995 [Proteobacteria bacterium]|nr:hypothetical protein [Pseudomonadota bacterium]NOG61019.1 hypothetical protein [Pseudomonadota bacterium]